MKITASFTDGAHRIVVRRNISRLGVQKMVPEIAITGFWSDDNTIFYCPPTIDFFTIEEDDAN